MSRHVTPRIGCPSPADRSAVQCSAAGKVHQGQPFAILYTNDTPAHPPNLPGRRMAGQSASGTESFQTGTGGRRGQSTPHRPPVRRTAPAACTNGGGEGTASAGRGVGAKDKAGVMQPVAWLRGPNHPASKPPDQVKPRHSSHPTLKLHLARKAAAAMGMQVPGPLTSTTSGW